MQNGGLLPVSFSHGEVLQGRPCSIFKARQDSDEAGQVRSLYAIQRGEDGVLGDSCLTHEEAGFCHIHLPSCKPTIARLLVAQAMQNGA